MVDKIIPMTVSLPLSTKKQPWDPNESTRQTMSIRRVVPPSSSSSFVFNQEEAGTTVSIGGSADIANSSITCATRIPEVQSVNGQDHQNKEKNQQCSAHVVKIKINPVSENGKVVSTIRLNFDHSPARGIEESYNCSGEKNGLVVICASNGLMRSEQNKFENDTCVRVNVLKNDSAEADISNNQHKDNLVHHGNSQGQFKNGTSCFYYGSFQSPLANIVMSSGQCSPSDTLDSGTCSDLDVTPPPLSKKNSSTIILGGGVELTCQNNGHNRTGSLTSSGAEVDSDDNEDNESNISCDSLNNREFCGIRVNGSGGGGGGGGGNARAFSKKSNAFRVFGRSSNHEKDSLKEVNNVVEEVNDEKLSIDPERILIDVKNNTKNLKNDANRSNTIFNSSSNRQSPSLSFSKGLSSLKTVFSMAGDESRQDRRVCSLPRVKEYTYEERKEEQERFVVEPPSYYNRSSSTSYVYDDDRFYKFHLNELDNHVNTTESKLNEDRGKDNDRENEEECFAGYKILEREAIRSAKGTVRGVKNRVRAGIATFLQKPSSKNYRTRDAGKVVVYTTTMGIVRETYYACMKVKQILRTHLVKYEERDMFMSTEVQVELRDRIGTTVIQVPQLFIDGQYIGDADTIERLNESGELRIMLKPYKSPDTCTTCNVCGGYRLLPCPVCNGSKKSVHRNDFTTEFVALKCMNCDEVGLVRCQHC